MKFTIDTDTRTIVLHDEEKTRIDLYSKQSFEFISELWLKVGWNEKHPYTFTWFGRPIIQNPEDIIRIQEAIYSIKPHVIVETGIAHGGSLILYASLCKAMGHGRVIGVDVEIRSHNQRAIESHELFPWITMIEGDSTAPSTVNDVKALVKDGEKVLVILDSCHTKEHVLAELEAYHSLVSANSYLVATDGIMQYLYDVPRGRKEWAWDNPTAAAAEFASKHPEFVLEQPRFQFSESNLTEPVTHWPGAWLRRC
jgi:cephalosporin hydroxylase